MDHATVTWDHCLEHAELTNLGLRRANNQDAVAVIIAESEQTWLARGHLFMVADGMGAHAAGELASKLATDAVALSYYKLLDRSPPEAILAAIEGANSQIHSRGRASLDFKGMGTTFTGLLLLPQGVLVAHVGDSRAYRLRGDRLEQLTFDHSLVWEMRAAGQIADDESAAFVPKNIITRSLGPNPTVQADLEGPFPVQAGDTFLLCSDGLSGPVKDDEIGAVLQSMRPAEAVEALVDLANLRGGPDNITVVVVMVTAPLSTRPANNTRAVPVTRPARPVHPLLWTVLGASGLAAAAMAALGQPLAALACLLAAAVAAAAAVMQRRGGEAGRFDFDGRPRGRGPYRAVTCPPDAALVDHLGSLLSQLRDAAACESWNVDWARLDAIDRRAAAARGAGNYGLAIRESFQAIRFMLDQLKRQRETERR